MIFLLSDRNIQIQYFFSWNNITESPVSNSLKNSFVCFESANKHIKQKCSGVLTCFWISSPNLSNLVMKSAQHLTFSNLHNISNFYRQLLEVSYVHDPYCKVCIWAKWPIRLELITVPLAWNNQEYFYSHWMGCYSIAGLPLRSKFAGTHLYTWVKRGTVRVYCLAQEQNAALQPGLEPGPLNPESSALIIRPPCLPLKRCQKKKRRIVKPVLFFVFNLVT